MVETLWNIVPIVIAIALGYFAGFVTAAMLVMKSEADKWEEQQAIPFGICHDSTDDVPHDDNAEVVWLKQQLASTQGALAEARADADFYYKMATGG